MVWGHWFSWQCLTVLSATTGFSSCVGYHPEVHGGPARASNVCQECHHQEHLRDDTDIWHTWQEKPGPVQEWQPKYGERSRLCLYFHLLCLVSVLFYQEWESFHATVLEMPEVQKCPCQSWKDTAAPSGRREQTKTSPFEHLSFLNESFLLCIKLISYNGTVCCRETAGRITKFRRGSLPWSWNGHPSWQGR